MNHALHAVSAEEVWDAIGILVDVLAAGYPPLAQRARIPVDRDGYPTRASGAQPGTIPAPNPDHELNIGGVAVDYADPTGNAAAIETQPADPVKRRANTAERHLRKALVHLQTAAAQFPESVKAEAETATGEDQWCRHHLTAINKCEPRSTGDLCDFCWSYQRVTHKMPPAALLTKRQAGRRLTSKEVG